MWSWQHSVGYYCSVDAHILTSSVIVFSCICSSVGPVCKCRGLFLCVIFDMAACVGPQVKWYLLARFIGPCSSGERISSEVYVREEKWHDAILIRYLRTYPKCMCAHRHCVEKYGHPQIPLLLFIDCSYVCINIVLLDRQLPCRHFLDYISRQSAYHTSLTDWWRHHIKMEGR